MGLLAHRVKPPRNLTERGIVAPIGNLTEAPQRRADPSFLYPVAAS